MKEKLRILILEDNKADTELIVRELKKGNLNFEYQNTETEQEFLHALKNFNPDVILSDYALPQYDGMQALEEAKKISPHTPFIIVTGSLNEETAVECIKRGAWDYVIKQHLAQLIPAIKTVIELQKERFEKYKLDKELYEMRWLLEVKELQSGKRKRSLPSYGDVTSLNKDGIILHSVGKEMLAKLSADVMDLIDTSIAIYENNGNLAFGIFGASWCQVMDEASRELCNTDDNKKALTSGKWLCHECCWHVSAEPAIKKGKPTDIDCVGGIKLYAVPIKAQNEVVGAINVGYGNPPTDEESLKKLANTFKVDHEKLASLAKDYKPRPTYIIEITKKRLHNIALLIGEMVENEQKKKALTEAELQKEIILNATKELFVYYDPHLKIIWANKTAADTAGLSVEEMIGKHCYQVWHDRTEPCENCVVMKVKETKKYQSGQSKELAGRLWALRGYPVLDENGEITNLIEFGLDITEQKKAELKYETYVTNSPTPFFITNSKGDYVYVNPAATDLLGYNQKELLSMNVKDVSHPENMESNLETFPQLLEGKHVRQEISLLHKSGKKVYAILDALMLDENNIIAFCPDTTARHRQEEVQKVLYNISEAINTTQTQHELYSVIHEELKKILNVKNFYIVRYNKTKDLLEFPYHADEKVSFNEHPAKNTLSGYVIKTGKSLFADTKTMKKLHKQGKIGKADEGTEAKIWIGVPLKYEEESIGVLAVQSYTDEDAFTRDDLSVLELVSNTIALGIKHKMEEEYNKRNSESLKQSEEIAKLGYFERNWQTGEGYYSEGFLRLLGYTNRTEALTHEEFQQHIHPQDRERVLRHIKLTLDNHEAMDINFELVKIDGEVIHVHGIAQNWYDNDDKPLISKGTFQDVTEKLATEKQLLQNEEKYRALFDQSYEGIFLHDIEGNILEVNERACEQLGYTREELFNKKVFEIQSKAEDSINQPIDEVLKRWKSWKPGIRHYLEAEHARKDGTIFPVQVSTGVIHYGDRNLVLAVVQDISERKEYERKIAESEEKYRTLVDNMVEGVLVIKNMKCVYANPAIETISGLTVEEIKEITILDITHEEDKKKIHENYEKRLQGQQFEPYDFRIVRPGGEIRWINITGASIIWQNEPALLYFVTDVTDRKKSEQALEESEEKLRNVVERSVDGIIITDIYAKIATWNVGMENITGLLEDEVLGKYIWDVQFSIGPNKKLGEDKYEQVKNSTIKFLSSGKNPFGSDVSEQMIRRKDGELRTIQSVLSVVKTSRGNILSAISRDVTFQKNAEENLRKSREKLRETLEATAEGIWEWHLEKDTLYFSPRYYTMLGYEPNEFPADKKRWEKLLHPDDRKSVMKKEQEFVDSSMDTYSDEFRMMTKTGGYRWIRSKGRVVEWSKDEKPVRVIGSHEDITYQKLAEMEVQKMHQSYINIVESSINGILILDTEGMISYVNPEAQKILDRSEDELIGKPFGFPITRAGSNELEILTKKRKTYFVDMRTTQVKWEGADCVLVLLHDITFKKIAEQKLQETNRKLEELSKALEKKVEEQVKQLRDKDHLLIKQSRHAAMGEMISNIAHQWRQPLTAVGAIVQDIEEAYKYGELSEEYLNDAIKNSMEQLDYMSHTIDDFRNFFVPDRLMERFSINRSIKKTIHFIESSFMNNAIEINTDLNVECDIEGFSNEYTQVLLNVLNNAKDAIKQSKVEKPRVWISLEKLTSEEHCCEVVISNNGGRIPEDIIDKIFDPYFTTKHQSEGTGLGLYMSKIIIEKMKGTIQVENTEDGVKFIIRV